MLETSSKLFFITEQDYCLLNCSCLKCLTDIALVYCQTIALCNYHIYIFQNTFASLSFLAMKEVYSVFDVRDFLSLQKYPSICTTGEKQKSYRRYAAKFTLKGKLLFMWFSYPTSAKASALWLPTHWLNHKVWFCI